MHSVFRMSNQEPGLTPDDLRHQAAMSWVDVLDDDDDRSEVGWHSAENLGQGADAPRGCGDGHDVEWRIRRRHLCIMLSIGGCGTTPYPGNGRPISRLPAVRGSANI
jgi:hypothetical protein